MFETAAELSRLQELLDASVRKSTPHLQSIVTPGERTLDAEQLVRVVSGMCTLALATVTRAGEPRVSGVDGHLFHGEWLVGTAPSAAKARHLTARPAVSVAHMRGDTLGVFVHGRARPLNPPSGPEDPRWPAALDYLKDHYGPEAFVWTEVSYYRIEPTWMVAYSPDPAALPELA
ncbi:pyridoxamine 5'-phosphate oxidase family protein [Pseudonocardia abyssalis]|uniref:Pyridoxamine 5'-phosphate oxidase family protein n=1 Tax=Pseudonocardia abyssalis TaxID=2792008 RepID=A0ABS6V0C2_9PSEU|nr:pyridoxamine 5'-phosphate oxidase family protein [Pseudonocardia abyssalis]MBW0115741.1 pyridoxamine 5'-phosphate oxidase family protein [Pseudonocardia abyssalis]MBW0137414.1 pyridoxamine 5'-phosphate oxidase family protein [Pseudonocardia abyssalis]